MSKTKKDMGEKLYPELRSCATYNPKQDMITLKPYREGEPPSLWLEVKYRVLWFNAWCQENGVRPMIDDGEVSYDPAAHAYKAVCSIYMDGELAARSSAYISENRDYPAQIAATAAKGRALANLGFGTLSGGVSEQGGLEPCDAGIPIPNITFGEDGVVQPIRPSRQSDGQAKPAAKPSPKKMPVTPKTKSEALDLVCVLKKHEGETMRDVMATDPEYITWLAGRGERQFTPASDVHRVFQQAAILILDN